MVAVAPAQLHLGSQQHCPRPARNVMWVVGPSVALISLVMGFGKLRGDRFDSRTALPRHGQRKQDWNVRVLDHYACG